MGEIGHSTELSLYETERLKDVQLAKTCFIEQITSKRSTSIVIHFSNFSFLEMMKITNKIEIQRRKVVFIIESESQP